MTFVYLARLDFQCKVMRTPPPGLIRVACSQGSSREFDRYQKFRSINFNCPIFQLVLLSELRNLLFR